MVRRTAKSPEAFRTISEAADVLDLPQHVLRFWETRFSQIKPMKRSGGRRYYRPNDITLLRGIKYLLYDEGYTIKGVQRILREQGIAHVIGLAPSDLSDLEAATAVTEIVAPADPAQNSPAHAVDSGSVNGADPVLAALNRAKPAVEAPPASQHILRPDPVPEPAISTPVVAAPPVPGSSLRFVPEPEDRAEHQPQPRPQAPTLPRAPVPPVATPPPAQIAQHDALHSSAPPMQKQPDATSTPFAVAQHRVPSHLPTAQPGTPDLDVLAMKPAGVALNAAQQHALAQALQTLMDCKSQLDQARPSALLPHSAQ